MRAKPLLDSVLLSEDHYLLNAASARIRLGVEVLAQDAEHAAQGFGGAP